MKPYIYLDHAATTPVAPEVLEAMRPFLEQAYGNPSSFHRYGKQARRALEDARTMVAECLNANASEIIFTSGGTEADNLAILGITAAIRKNESTESKRHIITTNIEHSAVAKTCQYLEQSGWEVTYLPVDSNGFVSVEQVQEALRPDTALVSVMHANNEVGSIQPIAEIGQLLRGKQVPFHTDAVQTVGKIPVDVKALCVDYLSLSAHKIYGPKGSGALYVRQGALKPHPLLFGGGQESQYRSGTENVAACVGLSTAMMMASASLNDEMTRLRGLQKTFIHNVLTQVPYSELNGPSDLERRVPGNANFSFPPAEGEALVLQLDLKGIGVSTGSACKSANIEPSPIILALGKPVEVAQASIRFSMGRQTTAQQLDEVVGVLSSVMARYASQETPSR